MGISPRFFAAALALLSAPYVCADVVDPAFNRFRSQVVGNKTTFTFGTGGVPLAGGSSTAGAAVSGGVDLSRGVAISTKHGPIVGSVSQKISNRAMGAAFARAAGFIGGPLGLAFLALPAIVDWMSDAGVSHDGAQFKGADPNAIPSSGTYWRTQDNPAQYAWSVQQLCRNWAAAMGYVYVGPGNGSPGGVCQASDQGYPMGISYTIHTPQPYSCPAGQYPGTGSCSATPPSVPISGTALEDAMTMANPSPEALAELYKLGETQSLANPIPELNDHIRAEFDARSPESVETTSSNTPTETKTKETTCATYTQIVGNTLSLVEQCESTTTTQPKDPETGLPVGEPTVETEGGTNTTPDPATKPEEPMAMACGVSGTPPCEVKVNESGTPTGDTFGQSNDLDQALNGRVDGLETARDMAGDTSWGIVPAWTEDTACVPWHLFTLPDQIGGDEVTLDLCPFMPVADGIANFVWVMLGIFAVTGMVSRAITGGGA